MNILILGSGGREHAIAHKLAQSKQLNKLFIAPGNAGTMQVGTNLPISVNDFQAIKKTVLKNQINMVFVGPEDPLVNGIHDFFLADEQLKNVAVIGPQKEAARLEGSKEFTKEFLFRHNIPTAGYQSFTKETVEKGYDFLETLKSPYVLKADGLAAGKGVLILDDINEAKAELNEMLTNKKFGEASNKVVIEEFLDGIELSCFVLTDGKSYKILPYAKDYKRISEGDKGLNTGGMGAVSPVSFADEIFLNKVEERIVKPTINGLQKDNLPYKGIVFIGLIKVNNEPFVIEYNVRFGDPETEVVVPRIKSDLVALFKAVADEKLAEFNLEIDTRTAATVMLVSGGYPEAYEKGKEILGLEKVTDSIVFHAGTKQENDSIFTNGGRVLAITSYGDNIQETLDKTYKNIAKIKFNGMNFRTDIGQDLI
ncbi:MAG: phosphoribosylamine--glycine ligase [Flavobacteriaceae bacterium]